MSHLLVLQSNGHMHLCQPTSARVQQYNVLRSNCQYGKFAVRPDLGDASANFNGICVVQTDGLLAETYSFVNIKERSKNTKRTGTSSPTR